MPNPPPPWMTSSLKTRKRPPVHVGRIVIVGKRKVPIGLEPADVGKMTLVGRNYVNHMNLQKAADTRHGILGNTRFRLPVVRGRVRVGVFSTATEDPHPNPLPEYPGEGEDRERRFPRKCGRNHFLVSRDAQRSGLASISRISSESSTVSGSMHRPLLRVAVNQIDEWGSYFRRIPLRRSELLPSTFLPRRFRL